MDDYNERFGGIARLYGTTGLAKLRSAHVAVIGVGGVGSWTAEALARSGVGNITLVDLDEVCVNNTNRQNHALEGANGKAKVHQQSARISKINPDCKVILHQKFFTEETAESILKDDFSYLVDAIDGLSNKCLLLNECRKREIPVITCGAVSYTHLTLPTNREV